MHIKNMIAVVQLYIFHRTGKEVIINIRPFADLIKLREAHDYAMGWFKANNVKLSILR